MVTEEDVVRALPENGFVRNYVIHAMKQTTAPLCYHLGVGLTLLSTTCPINYGMWYAGALRPNMFTLLIGRSGEDNKSSALNVGQGLLFSAAPDLIGDYPGSAEGLRFIKQQTCAGYSYFRVWKIFVFCTRWLFRTNKNIACRPLGLWGCTKSKSKWQGYKSRQPTIIYYGSMFYSLFGKAYIGRRLEWWFHGSMGSNVWTES